MVPHFATELAPITGHDADSGPQEIDNMKNNMRIIAVTGHRPDKLAPKPECYSRAFQERLVMFATEVLDRMDSIKEIDMLHVGMALGWDQAIAQAAVNLLIPWTAFIPCRGHGGTWPEESREIYRELLDYAVKVRKADVPYSGAAMMARNRDMIDGANEVLALYDRSGTGGTANAVQYAKTKKVKIYNVWDYWTGDKKFPEVK